MLQCMYSYNVFMSIKPTHTLFFNQLEQGFLFADVCVVVTRKLKQSLKPAWDKYEYYTTRTAGLSMMENRSCL